MKRLPHSVACAIILGLGAATSLRAATVESADVSGDWGVWSGWYWPFNATEPPNLYSDNEALSRYDAFAGSNSQEWEHDNHGPELNQPDWAGHCHAWAGASIWESMPSGNRVCGGVTFRPRDLAALMTEAYYNDTLATEISLFRPTPGLLWRYLRQELGGQNSMHGHAMALIGNLTTIKGQVWNFPIYRYDISYVPTGNGTCTGTITLWFADDGSSSYADYLGLGAVSISYTFTGVTLDNSGAPLDSGSWAGNNASQYPTSIWRPYYAGSWSSYLANPGLDGEHLAQILDLNNLGDSLNAANTKWNTGGAGSWYAQGGVTHDSTLAAQAGSTGNNQSTWLQTTVVGPGTISFWEKVSSQAGSDFLKFLVDGQEQPGSISGNVDWRPATFVISGAGTHILTWVYAKDGAGAAGSDTAWVDQVAWQSGVVKATVVTIPAPAARGFTSGDGIVDNGATVTVCASPKPGCCFANWTENGQIVSTTPCYTFPATGSRNLVANFALVPPTLTMDKIQNEMVVSWSTNVAGFMLESSTNVVGPQTWSAVVAEPEIVGSSYCVTNHTDGSSRFFRLRHP